MKTFPVSLKVPLDAFLSKLPSQMKSRKAPKGVKLRSKREERAPSCRGKNQEVGCNYQYGNNAGEISADAALAGGCISARVKRRTNSAEGFSQRTACFCFIPHWFLEGV